MSNGRKITFGIKSSLNLPPPKEIRADIAMLERNRDACADTVRGYKREIKKKREEQQGLRDLAANPGIYDAEACAKAADRCDGDIESFEAIIGLEQAKVEQLDMMIKKTEERLCQSVAILRSIGSPIQG